MTSEESKDDQLDEVAHDFVECLRRGTNPAPADFAARYPQLAERILEVFPVLALMEGAAACPSGHAADAPRPGVELELPRQIGDYLVVREIGRGGMGIVYEAQQLSLRRRVALKLLPTHAVLNPAQLERFRREAQAAAGLQHRNIVPVYEVADQLGVHFYAMQFVRGMGLDGVIREIHGMQQATAESPIRSASTTASSNLDDATSAVASGLLTGRFESDGAPNGFRDRPARELLPSGSGCQSGARRSHTRTLGASAARLTRAYFQSVARIGADVADALEYAHRQGVLHRDIKPSNVLVDTCGTPWVTDFGLAKTDGSENLTNAGDVAGTIRYLAPERLRGWSEPRSDVYGLGLTLYELATLRPAFEGADQGRLIAQIAREDPPRPRQVAAGIPKDLETIILKAISKEPEQRYQTAAALGADLKRFLAGEAIVARRASRVERTRLWCRRNPLAASLAGSVGMLLLLLAVGSTVAALWLRRERDSAVEAGRLAVASQQRAQREAERARSEATKAAEINRLLQETFSLADPNNAPGKEVTVRGVLDRAVEKLAGGLAEQPEVEAALRDTIGWTYKNLGQFEQAERQLRAALALRRPTLGDQHADTATTLDHLCHLLADAYPTDSDQYREAIELCRQAVAIRRDALGADHTLTIESRGYLSFLEHQSGDAAQAQRTMGSLGSLLGVDLLKARSLDAALTRIRNLWSAGQREEAMQFIERTVAPLDEKFRSPETLPKALEMIGARQHYAKDYQTAVPLALAASEHYGKVYGGLHPSVATCLYSAAAGFAAARQFNEAETYHRKALAMRRNLLDHDHPDLAYSLHGLANVLVQKKGPYPEAEALYREALAIRRRIARGDDADLASTLYGLARLLHRRHRDYDEAEALYREALAMRQNVFGREHAQVGWAAYSLALLLQGQRKDFAAIEPLYRQTIEAWHNVYTKENLEIDYAWVLYRFAQRLQHDRHDYRQAERYYREALAVRRQKLGEDHSQVGYATMRLGWLLDHDLRRFDEAEALYREALTIYRKRGRDHPFVAIVTGSLAPLLDFHAQDFAEAEALYRETLAIRARSLGDSHEKTQTARWRLAQFLATCPDRAYRKPDVAVALAKQLIEQAPKHAAYHTTLAMARCAGGAWKSAIQSLDVSNQLLGRASATNRFFLAIAYWNLGEREESRGAYEAAVASMNSDAPSDIHLARYRALADALVKADVATAADD